MASLATLLGWTTIATILWSLLALSAGITILGIARRAWSLLIAAAPLSLVFSALAILSIGPLTLLLTFLQLAGATALRVTTNRIGRLFVVLGGVLAWIVLVARLLVPSWLAAR